MKIKFKPTNLGRARPKSKPQAELPVSEKLLSDEKTEENTCSGGYKETEVGENALHPATSSSSLPASNLLTISDATTTTPPSVMDNPTPLFVPSGTVTPTTLLPTTSSCEPSVTYDSTMEEATLHNELPLSLSETTSTSIEATPPTAASEPPDATHELATSTLNISPLHCPNSNDSQPCNGSSREDGPLSNALDSQDGSEPMEDSSSLSAPLTLDVSLPLEIFATSLSGERNEASHENGSKEGVEDAGRTKKGPKVKEKKITGVKRPRKEATKSKPEGAARSNGRVQPPKPRAKRASKKSTDSKERSSGTDKSPSSASTTSTSGAENGSPTTAAKSPSPKKPRTNQVREAPDRAVMTMRDLIYYNPSANPMSTVEDTKKKEKSPSSANPSRNQTPSPQQREQGITEEDEGEGDEEEETRIVPQLRIGEDGKIVVDQRSLLVETTATADQELESDVIIEGAGHTTSASYRNKYKATRWTKDETKTFFTALGKVGTDFTMMTLLLPRRSRKELKNKFKKEEKVNPHLISQALKVQQLARTIKT